MCERALLLFFGRQWWVPASCLALTRLVRNAFEGEEGGYGEEGGAGLCGRCVALGTCKYGNTTYAYVLRNIQELKTLFTNKTHAVRTQIDLYPKYTTCR